MYIIIICIRMSPSPSVFEYVIRSVTMGTDDGTLLCSFYLESITVSYVLVSIFVSVFEN
jgi:hypothetical protein